MSEIKQEMKKGLLWTALDKYSGQIVGIFISMVLARLLTPNDYGVVATASVLLAFLSIFSTIGIGPAIIQREDLNQKDLDNIFTFTIFLGFALCCISFVSSWLIAYIYGNPLLKPVIQILSFGMFLGTINMVPAALMSKHKRFKEMATRGIVFQVVFGIIGILSAFYGAGVYALVCPQILASFCTFFYNNHFYPVRISWHFSIEPLKKIFSYSSFVFLSEVINYFSRNLDKLIIGKTISADALGYYEKSYRLMQMPLNNVSSVIYPVLQPVMSSLQNDMKEMADKYTKIVKYIAIISFPIAVIMLFSAKEIIIVMFGANWIPSIASFKVLVISIPLMLICNPTGAIFSSCNATKQMFRVTLSNTTVTISLFIIAAVFWNTIESIALGWTVSIFINTFNSYYRLYHNVFKTSLIPVVSVLIKPTLGCLFLGLIYIFTNLCIVACSLPLLISLAIKLVIGGCYILVYIQYFGIFNIKDCLKYKR